MTGAAVDPEPADDREHEVLRPDAGLQAALDEDLETAWLALQQALRREHVTDLGRADAEGERAEGAVRARVAVAADDRHARLRAAELRADHVHDAAPRIAEAEQLDAVHAGVALERRDLRRGGLVADRDAADELRGIRRGRVVERAERPAGPAHGQAARLERREGLRRRDFVDEVQVHVEDRRRLGRFRHDLVGLPDLLEQGPWTHANAACGRRALCRDVSIRLTTSRKARTPDSTMLVLTLLPR